MAEEHVDHVDAHDRGSVDAEEVLGVELFFEGLHALAHGEGFALDVQLGVRAARGDVLDSIDGHGADLAAELDGDAIHVVVAFCGRRHGPAACAMAQAPAALDPLIFAEWHLGCSIVDTAANLISQALTHARHSEDALQAAPKGRGRDLVATRVQRQLAHLLSHAGDYIGARAAAGELVGPELLNGVDEDDESAVGIVVDVGDNLAVLFEIAEISGLCLNLGITADEAGYIVSDCDATALFATARLGDVAAGQAFTCVLHANGRVQCWGANGAGQLGSGSGTPTQRVTPAPVLNLLDAVALSAGNGHVCAVRATGQVRCWGSNFNGQLGDGTRNNRSSPGPVTGVTSAVAVACGSSHTCALLADGTVKCWGSNSRGQLGNSSGGESLVPVPMRDGTRLYADIYRPRREGKFPVLVVRTPYGVQRDGMHETKVKFAQRGYAVVVQDVGRALNPPEVEGQMHGALAQGVGWALLERMAYDDAGRLRSATLMDYALPGPGDVPLIETVVVEEPAEAGPYGARGVGEPPWSFLFASDRVRDFAAECTAQTEEGN